jgi:nicotinate-nucleotide pyrophosphorylase (carboxylating)
MKAQIPLPQDITTTVQHALAEDIGSGDLTAQLIPKDSHAEATVISREDAVLCGTEWFNESFLQLDEEIQIIWHASDGDNVQKDQVLCSLKGSARAILSGERTALNFLQTLSATATQAKRYANAVAGTDCRVLDTRKTIPGLRNAQKYAVACGGCYNHRLGLYDAILIKENHILAAGSITAAVEHAHQATSDVLIEVEVENLDELREALSTKHVTRVLLDNMDNATLEEAVTINAGQAQLEASGGITLENIHATAKTGVDFISTGALTKDIKAIDLSMRFVHPGS